jgi:hypothetical protein
VAPVPVCSKINTKHINTVWAERTILNVKHHCTFAICYEKWEVPTHFRQKMSLKAATFPPRLTQLSGRAFPGNIESLLLSNPVNTMDEEYNFVYVEDKKYNGFQDPSIQDLLMKW